MPVGGEDDPAGVDDRAVEVEEDDGEAHLPDANDAELASAAWLARPSSRSSPPSGAPAPPRPRAAQTRSGCRPGTSTARTSTTAPRPRTCAARSARRSGRLRRAAAADGYLMRQTGPARPFCASDTIYDRNALVLAYGTTRQFGVFKCSSSVAGLKCFNASGNGFVLSSQALVHAQGSRAAVRRRSRRPPRNIVCGYVDRARRHGVDGVRDQERPEAAAAGRSTATPATRSTSASRYGTPAAPRRFSAPATRGRCSLRSSAAAKVLAYGKTIRFGGISCASADHRPDVPEPQRPRLLPQPRALADVLTQVRYRPGIDHPGSWSRKVRVAELLLDGCANTRGHARPRARLRPLPRAARAGRAARRRRRLVLRRARQPDPRRVLLDGRQPARCLDIPGAAR